MHGEDFSHLAESATQPDPVVGDKFYAPTAAAEHTHTDPESVAVQRVYGRAPLSVGRSRGGDEHSVAETGART